MTLEQSQGLQTYIENVDPEQGYIQAKFERCHFNNLRETDNVKVFFFFFFKASMSVILEHVQKSKTVVFSQVT